MFLEQLFCRFKNNLKISAPRHRLIINIINNLNFVKQDTVVLNLYV